MKALLSIKPEFAEKIFSGDKGFEYRKAIFKRHDVKTVIVYATRPIAKIIGEFDVEEIISGQPDDVWQKTKSKSGITRDFFDTYYKDRRSAFAIKIGHARAYAEPVCPTKIFENFVPPQSYMYVESPDDANSNQLELALESPT
jgi:predicted transcriptional regulator